MVDSTDVAVKIQEINSDNTEPVLLNELMMLKQARNVHIPEYLDSFLEDNKLYMMMELVDGVAVSELVADCKLRSSTIAAITKGILEALKYLQGCNIMHRDIKRSNVLLARNGDVKVIDLGFALKVGHVRERGVGTSAYMAPEVLTTEYNVGIDIWSLGMTVVEMINGTHPYAEILLSGDEMTMAILRKIMKKEMPIIQDEDDLPRALKRFLPACLRHNAAKRATASELLEHKFIRHADSHEKLRDTLNRKIQYIREKAEEKKSICGPDTNNNHSNPKKTE
jgi:serine/threonine protein kinase